MKVRESVQKLLDEDSWLDAPDIETVQTVPNPQKLSFVFCQVPHCVLLDSETGEVINSSAAER